MAKIILDKEDKTLIAEIIKDEIEQALNRRLSSKGAPMRGDKWTEEDDEVLKEDFVNFVVSAGLDRGRSTNSVIARLRKLEVI
jgi:hypothetical protein